MRVAMWLALAACSIPEKHLAPDLACLDEPLPAIAPSTVTITGTVQNLSGDTAIAGAAIQGYSSTVPLPSTTSDLNGAFRYVHDTGRVPHEEYVHASKAGYVDAYTYPQLPVASDTTLQVRMLTPTDVAAFATTAQVAMDPSKGTALLGVVDCNGSPLGGATVSTTPPGTVRYFALGMPAPSATTTDASGFVLIANLAPGRTTLTASLDGVALRAHDFDAVANAFVLTLIEP